MTPPGLSTMGGTTRVVHSLTGPEGKVAVPRLERRITDGHEGHRRSEANHPADRRGRGDPDRPCRRSAGTAREAFRRCRRNSGRDRRGARRERRGIYPELRTKGRRVVQNGHTPFSIEEACPEISNFGQASCL